MVVCYALSLTTYIIVCIFVFYSLYLWLPCMCVSYVYIVPSEPTSLTVVNITDTTVTLSWMPPDPPNGIIIGYQVLQYRRDNSSDLIYLDTNDTALNYTVTGLTNNVEYVFSVRAYTAVGYGADSSEVTARASK